MQNSKLKMVVLDMAGTTMVDKHEVEYCFAKAARDSGLLVSDERILSIQGWAKRFVFELLWEEQIGKSHPEYLQKVNNSFEMFKVILETYYKKQPVHPTEGALELFELLKANDVKIVLTTGFYREVTDIILQKLGWDIGLDERRIGGGTDNIIDQSITSDEVEHGRPAPDMVFKAMKTWNITDAKEVICIGDTPSDLGCGKNAGCMYAFGLTNGTHSESQLSIYENDGLWPSLVFFKNFLLEHELVTVFQNSTK